MLKMSVMKKLILLAPLLTLASCAPALAPYNGPKLTTLVNATANIDGADVAVEPVKDNGWVITQPAYKLIIATEPNRPGIKGFSLVLSNTSKQPIKVLWDDSAISMGSIPSAVYHVGTKYNEVNSSKPATIVPAGGNLVDVAYPSALVSYDGGRYGAGWIEGTFFEKLASGSTAGFLLALEVEGKRQNLTFKMTAK